MTRTEIIKSVLRLTFAAFFALIAASSLGLAGSAANAYEWRSRPESAEAARRGMLKIKTLFEASDQAHGYRHIHAALVRADERASDELVRELMRELGPVPCQPRPGRRSLADQGAAWPIPDLLSSLASLSVTLARA